MKNARNGFTLIELLVVIAIIAILAALLLPAFSQAKNKAKLATCQSNFHQVYIGCNIYAGDNGDWFPIWEDQASHPLNVIKSESYNRYVVQTGPGPNTPVPTGVPSNNTSGLPWEFQNLGFLYDSKLIGDGGVLYCPSFANFAGSSLVEQNYSTPRFMSTDDGGNPSSGLYRVRSSICFNPMVDTNSPASGGGFPRLFPKTSSMNSVPGGGHRLFGVDYIGGNGSSGGSYNPNWFPHYPSKGWDVMFTDGSVKFCKSIDAYNAVLAFPASDNGDPPPVGPGGGGYMPVLLDLEAVP